jgi:hypothetical protein
MARKRGYGARSTARRPSLLSLLFYTSGTHMPCTQRTISASRQLDTPPPPPLLMAQVGEVSWDVLATSQALKAGELTYIFSTPAKGVFYALTLGAATEPEAVGVVEAVLENVTLLR